MGVLFQNAYKSQKLLQRLGGSRRLKESAEAMTRKLLPELGLKAKLQSSAVK